MELGDVSAVGVDDFEESDEVPIFGECFLVDGLAALGTVELLLGIIFDEFLHAGGATAMLVNAHDHRRVLILIELPHAEEAFLLHLVRYQVLDLCAH